MTQSVGQSRGSQKHKRFVQDSANSFVVDAFIDVSQTAPGSPVDEEGYIVDSGAGSLDGSWGTITGLQDKDIIRYRASQQRWVIVHSAVADNEGSKAYVKDDDILYTFDGGDWNVASGSGGGVKNFAQKQATSYKIADWTSGNDATFGTPTTTTDSTLSIDSTTPLDGKKSFLITTGSASADDWYYLTVDIDEYARGGAIAFTFDYTWDGEEPIAVKIFDSTLTNEFSTELTTLKNTENDYKKSRNSRTIYAHSDTDTQILVGFQFPSGITTGKEFRFDNLKVTDDIGTIGTGSRELVGHLKKTVTQSSMGDRTGVVGFGSLVSDDDIIGDKIFEVDFQGTETRFYALQDCHFDVSFTAHMTTGSSATEIYINTIVSNNSNTNVRGDESGVAGRVSQVSGSFALKKGEYFALGARGVDTLTNSGNECRIHITATAQEEGLRFLQVPNGEKLKDAFSARIDNNGTASVISDPYGFISSVIRDSLGIVTINFKSGFFTQVPSVTFTAEQLQGYPWPAIKSISANHVTVQTAFHRQGVIFNGYDVPFDIHVAKQETSPDIIGVPVAIQGQTHEQDTYFRYSGDCTLAASTNIVGFPDLIESFNTSAAQYVQDAGGHYIEILESGTFNISTNVIFNTATTNYGLGFVKNAVLPAEQAFSYLTFGSDRLLQSTYDSTTVNPERHISWQGRLVKGDKVYMYTEAGDVLITPSGSRNNLSVSKVGTQPLLDGGLVERPGSTLFVHTAGSGSAGYGSTNTAIRRFTTISESSAIANGDVKYTDSATDGMSVEILEDGVYNVSVSHASDLASGTNWGWSVNSTELTTTNININPNNKISNSASNTAGNDTSNSATRHFRKGDILRVHAEPSHSITVRNARCFFSVTKLGQTVKYSSRVYKEDPIAWQEKELASTLTSDVADIPELRFDNLEIGKTYRVTLQALMTTTSTTGAGRFRVNNNGTYVSSIYTQSGASEAQGAGTSAIFVAQSTSLITEWSRVGGSTQQLLASGNVRTYVQLEELPFHSVVSKW